MLLEWVRDALSKMRKLKVCVQTHPDVAGSLALIDYDTSTIYLGNDVDPDDIEELVEDTLTHECIHYILFKHFGINVAKSYDRIYGEVEPRGRIIALGVQGVE